MIESSRLLVLYGSQTYTAQEAAERIWRISKVLGFRGPVQAMDDYPISKLIHEEFVVFVCATTGQGDEPDNMKRFWKFLLRKSLPSNSLVKLKFGVLALGDSSYSKFNFVGKKLHRRLLQLGGTPLLDVGLCDYQHDLGHDAVMQPWVKEFYSCLHTYFPQIKLDQISSSFIPRWSVSLLKNEETRTEGIEDIYFGDGKTDNFNDAILMVVESNVRTTDKSHFQDVRLITFKSVDESDINYKPGDIFNIRPRNLKEDIEDLFGIFETHNLDIKPQYKLFVKECHDDMPVPYFLRQPLTMHEIAEQYWDLRAYPTQYFFSLLALVSDDALERGKCQELASTEGQEDWLNYCRRPRRTVLEVLHDFHKSASKLTIPILFELFSTIKPRSFSIASSALPSNGRLVELLVAVVEYYSKLKKPRLGLCSNWMKELSAGEKVYGWVKKGTFQFPNVKIPHILIGPGTGLAPFRSLLQTRTFESTARAATTHLFVGCRYKHKDFHCAAELERMVAENQITLYCAFSRDQDKKIYVQHKIAEHSQTLWELISQGAYIFISGNSKNMPDNVRDAIVEDVICKAGGLTIEASRSYLKNMEATGILQVETW